jgi:hypothetical protein
LDFYIAKKYKFLRYQNISSSSYVGRDKKGMKYDSYDFNPKTKIYKLDK